MKLLNRTEHPATLLRSVHPGTDDRMLGCVVARPTFVVRDGALVATPDEPWPLGVEPVETPLGRMPGDRALYSGGIDVLLGGRVRAPGNERRGRFDVEIEIGRRYRRRIAVFGDRRWIRDRAGALVPSEPEPVRSMELVYERAFGGTAPTEHGIPMPFLDNPAGRGFYLDEPSAEGQHLPNLEDPRHLVTDVHAMPEPVGLGYYLAQGALRARAALDHPALAQPTSRTRSTAPPVLPEGADTPLSVEQINPILFNQGHPGNIIPPDRAPRAGDLIRVTGGLRDGDLQFALPDLSLHACVQLEDRLAVIPLHLDQIGIVAGEGRVFFSLRTVFDYRLRKGERRFVTLHAGAAPSVAPVGYAVDLPADPFDRDNRPLPGR